MYTAWTQHIKDPNEKIRWQNTVVAAKPVLEHIRTLLTSLEVGVGQDEVNKEYYSSPSWAYRQAHNNGYRHCLKTVLSLIDLDKQAQPKESDDRPVRTDGTIIREEQTSIRN